LIYLFDQWPAGPAYRPPKDASPGAPVLGATPGRSDTGTHGSENAEPVEKSVRPYRLAWSLVALVLILLTLANTLWTFHEPLSENPVIGNWMHQAGWLQPGMDGLLRSPEQLQLVSRDMHSHPTRSGILVLSFTFMNLARDTQVYPVLEITLLDAVSRPVARRRLQPGDYLRHDADINMGLAPDVYLPVLLEFADPGMQAVGFEIRFL